MRGGNSQASEKWGCGGVCVGFSVRPPSRVEQWGLQPISVSLSVSSPVLFEPIAIYSTMHSFLC